MPVTLTDEELLACLVASDALPLLLKKRISPSVRRQLAKLKAENDYSNWLDDDFYGALPVDQAWTRERVWSAWQVQRAADYARMATRDERDADDELDPEGDEKHLRQGDAFVQKVLKLDDVTRRVFLDWDALEYVLASGQRT